MKKLKLKIKRGLFGFFQEEILKSVGYSDIPQTQVQFVSERVDMKTLSAEIMLAEDNSQMCRSIPFEAQYEEALSKCRRSLFEEVMKYATVDEKQLLDQGVFPHRNIRVRLFVGRLDKW